MRKNEKHAAPESGLQAVDTNACCTTNVTVFLERIVSRLTSIYRYWKMVSFYNLSDADAHRAIPSNREV